MAVLSKRKGPATRAGKRACSHCPLKPKPIGTEPVILPKYKRDGDDLMAYRNRKFLEREMSKSSGSEDDLL